jgi:multidrug efflux pump subunit AcrA (membrane-fusion protein)
MSSHSNSGDNNQAKGIALAENDYDRSQAEQLSLLPEYTDADSSEVEKDGLLGSAASKWLTVLGFVLLAMIGFGLWRWWQGRSPSQSQQRRPQASPVNLAMVETATVEETSTFTGTLEAEQASDIQAEQAGRVAQILVNQGQTVSAGTSLMRLSADQEQADVDAALARIDIAQAAQQRAESELEALRAERDRVQAEINLQQEQFSRTSTLVERGALAREQLDLKQRDLSVARANLNVEISSSAGEALQTGRITFISPQVEQTSQFIPTEATFPNSGGQLRDGQFVRSKVIWESRPGQPVVPQSAVIDQGEDRFVYVPQEQDGQMVAMRQPAQSATPDWRCESTPTLSPPSLPLWN